jgi:hypothetical protein
MTEESRYLGLAELKVHGTAMPFDSGSPVPAWVPRPRPAPLAIEPGLYWVRWADDATVAEYRPTSSDGGGPAWLVIGMDYPPDFDDVVLLSPVRLTPPTDEAL